VTIYDRRPAAELADAVAALGDRPLRLALAADPAEVRALLAAAELIVTSPSISPDYPTTDAWLRDALAAARDAGVELVSEVELFLRLTRARILAVTGTKGKTTTVALLGAILEAGGVSHAIGGNIGQPLIERADELGPDDWAVLELSELQLPTISRGADVAVYTNIGADHLDRHGSVEAYRAVKARLAELSAERGTVVLNRDDPGCAALGASLRGEVAWYGLAGGGLRATVIGGTVVVGETPLLPVDEVPLPGRHMLSNVLAASLAAATVGVDAGRIAHGIRGFAGVPHRLETVAEHDGLRWVNDSQATIPMAALAGLDAFDAPVVLIAGGRGKGLDYEDFADRAAARCRAAVLIGETADDLERLLAERLPVDRASSMDEAVRLAAERARRGDVVLLSPAAASFDMFADYAARGEAFRAAVAALLEGDR
jgi:UDP-N-acetylmuramoylalanine--D-glutamate ligase